jgi:hypothetical protein
LRDGVADLVVAAAMSAATPRAGVSAVSPTSARNTGIPVDALAQSLASEYLVEKKEELAAAGRARRLRRPWRRIFSIAAMVVCAVVWLIPSLGSTRTPALPAQRQDASARLTLFLAAQRVREYERRHGRLPASISQTGVAHRVRPNE